MSDERPRECGEPMSDGSGLVCRKACAPGLDYHGGGHIFAPPDMSEEDLREGIRQVLTGESSPVHDQAGESRGA